MTSTDPAVRRSRLSLLGLAALFFVPLVLSFYLYYGTSWRPAGGTQSGELVTPARPLPDVELPAADGSTTPPGWLRGKWRLVYVGAGDCDAGCRAALVTTRQVRLALDKDVTRVARAFLFTGRLLEPAGLAAAHPDLVAASLAGPGGDELAAALPGGAGGRRVYLVDPLGNLVMSYPEDAAPKGMLQDLERLLRLSHIG